MHRTECFDQHALTSIKHRYSNVLCIYACKGQTQSTELKFCLSDSVWRAFGAGRLHSPQLPVRVLLLRGCLLWLSLLGPSDLEVVDVVRIKSCLTIGKVEPAVTTAAVAHPACSKHMHLSMLHAMPLPAASMVWDHMSWLAHFHHAEEPRPVKSMIARHAQPILQ